ncbi:hypothetical protein ACHAPJ_002739 [Fusarium lateritium]
MAMRAREEHHDTRGHDNRSAGEPKRKTRPSSDDDINNLFSDQFCYDPLDPMDYDQAIPVIQGMPRVLMSGATNDTSPESIRTMLEPMAKDIASIKTDIASLKQEIISIRQDIASNKRDAAPSKTYSSGPPTLEPFLRARNNSSVHGPRIGRTDSQARFNLKHISPFEKGAELLEGFPSMPPMPHYAPLRAGYDKPTYSRQSGDNTHKDYQKANFSP